MGCSSFQKVINGVEGLRLSTAAGRKMNEATMRDRDIHLAIAGKGPAGRGGGLSVNSSATKMPVLLGVCLR